MVFGRRKSLAAKQQESVAIQAAVQAQVKAQALAQVQAQFQTQTHTQAFSLSQQSDLKKQRVNKLSKPKTYTRPFSTTTSATGAAAAATDSSNSLTHHSHARKRNNVQSEQFTAATSAFKSEIRSQILDQDQNPLNNTGSVASIINKFETSNDVAASDDADTDSSSPHRSRRTLPSPPKSRRRLSNIFGSSSKLESPDVPELPPPATTSAHNKAQMFSVQQLSDTLATSSDTLVTAPSFPPSRRASFQPGTATRKTIASKLANEEKISDPTGTTTVTINLGAGEANEAALDQGHDGNDTRSFHEGDDENAQSDHPPPIARTETPIGLDYSHLGGLRLGSLRIVNGRVSPTASDVSHLHSAKVPLSDTHRRDVSSEYGSELGQADHHLYCLSSRSPLVTRNREVSGLSRASTVAASTVLPSDSMPKDASTAAAEYISMLPNSPYNSGRQSLVTLKRMQLNPDDESFSHSRSTSGSSYSTISHRSVSSVSMMSDSHVNMSNSPVSMMSDTGSVIRIPVKKAEFHDECGFSDRDDDDGCDDEGDDGNDSNDSSLLGTIPSDSEPVRRPSLNSSDSWHSAMKSESGNENHEAFDSAVEFQHYDSSKTQNLPTVSNLPSILPRPMPTGKEYLESPVLGADTCFVKLYSNQISREQQSRMSDSGYSSGNSADSSVGVGDNNLHRHSITPTMSTAEWLMRPPSAPAPAPAQVPAAPAATTNTGAVLPVAQTPPRQLRPLPQPRQQLRMKASSASMRGLPARPPPGRTILKDAPKPMVMPVVAQDKDKAKGAHKPKKLQKRSFSRKKKKAMVIQRVASLDLLSVPLVSPEMSAKLDFRAKGSPEMERTVDHDDVYVHASNSANGDMDTVAGNAGLGIDNNAGKVVGFRFPSPLPESENSQERDTKKQRRPSLRMPSARGCGSSWFGKSKANQQHQESESPINERDTMTMIGEFGTVTISPYDLAKRSSSHQEQQQQQQQQQQRRPEAERQCSSSMPQPCLPVLPLPGQSGPKNWLNSPHHWYEKPRNPPPRPPPPPPPAHSHSSSVVGANVQATANANANVNTPFQTRPSTSRGPSHLRQSSLVAVDDNDNEEEESTAPPPPPPPPSHSPNPMDIPFSFSFSPRKFSPGELSVESRQESEGDHGRNSVLLPSPPTRSIDSGVQWPLQQSAPSLPLAAAPSSRPLKIQPLRPRGPRARPGVEAATAIPTATTTTTTTTTTGPREPSSTSTESKDGGSSSSAKGPETSRWGSQAAKWRARRQSAGETLKRQSWKQQLQQLRYQQKAEPEPEQGQEQEQQQEEEGHAAGQASLEAAVETALGREQQALFSAPAPMAYHQPLPTQRPPQRPLPIPVPPRSSARASQQNVRYAQIQQRQHLHQQYLQPGMHGQGQGQGQGRPGQEFQIRAGSYTYGTGYGSSPGYFSNNHNNGYVPGSTAGAGACAGGNPRYSIANFGYDNGYGYGYGHGYEKGYGYMNHSQSYRGAVPSSSASPSYTSHTQSYCGGFGGVPAQAPVGVGTAVTDYGRI